MSQKQKQKKKRTKFTPKDTDMVIDILDRAHLSIAQYSFELNRARDFFRSKKSFEYEDEGERGRIRYYTGEEDKKGKAIYKTLPTKEQGREYTNQEDLQGVLMTLENLLNDFLKRPRDLRQYSHSEGDYWYGKVIWDIDTEAIEKILAKYEDDL